MTLEFLENRTLLCAPAEAEKTAYHPECAQASMFTAVSVSIVLLAIMNCRIPDYKGFSETIYPILGLSAILGFGMFDACRRVTTHLGADSQAIEA